MDLPKSKCFNYVSVYLAFKRQGMGYQKVTELLDYMGLWLVHPH